MSQDKNKQPVEEGEPGDDGTKQFSSGGNKITFQPVVPKFLQGAYSKIQKSGKKYDKSELPYEPEDRPDTEEDMPTVVADEFLKEVRGGARCGQAGAD